MKYFVGFHSFLLTINILLIIKFLVGTTFLLSPFSITILTIYGFAIALNILVLVSFFSS